MRLSYGLEAKQLQKQTLAPRMIQSMEILQMPIAALQERIDQELSENPMLEQQDVDPALPDVQEEDQERPSSLSDVERELVVKDNQSNADDFERLFNMDQEMPSTFDDFRRSSGRIDEDGERYLEMMANAVARPESLNDYLLHQLAEMDTDDQVELMAEKIISSLDARDGGYFRTSLRDLLPMDHTEKDFQLAQEALRVVQSLDPPGIAARDLRECLLNQLRPEMNCFEEMKRLIVDHLETLAENRLPWIQTRTGYSIETTKEASQ